MKKGAKIALWSVAAMVMVTASAAVGFYVGFGLGAKTMGSMAEINKAHDALAEVRTSMVALGKHDPGLSERQLAVHLRMGLFDLGELSMVKIHAKCTGHEKTALADAASYVAAHPDRVLFNGDPLLVAGVKFCTEPLVSP